jgi:hypothetical protein
MSLSWSNQERRGGRNVARIKDCGIDSCILSVATRWRESMIKQLTQNSAEPKRSSKNSTEPNHTSRNSAPKTMQSLNRVGKTAQSPHYCPHRKNSCPNPIPNLDYYFNTSFVVKIIRPKIYSTPNVCVYIAYIYTNEKFWCLLCM